MIITRITSLLCLVLLLLPIGASRNSPDDLSLACDLPTYSLAEWKAAHGLRRPPFPALFLADSSTHFAGMDLFEDMGRFVDAFGDEAIDTQPGYAQAGGHLNGMWPKSRIGRKGTLREIAARWNISTTSGGGLRGFYHSEFNCQSRICKRFTHEVRPVRLNDFKPDSNPDMHVNFLLGGVGSGLPFHRHAETVHQS
jgi:hypothetical protein